jgi:gephyrin
MPARARNGPTHRPHVSPDFPPPLVIQHHNPNTMSQQTLRAAILIVSTTAVEDPSTDKSGDILKDVFKQKAGQWTWEIAETRIVGDVIEDIQEAIKHWTGQDDPVNVIVTTGGTGFAVADNTPEVC